MKGKLFFAAAIIMIFASCGSGDYKDIVYTNNTGKKITFRTAEKDSPEYELEADKGFSLSSDVRGRAEIVYINEPLVTWRYKDGKDVYNIEFIGREEIKLEIRNYAGWAITLTEKYRLIWDDIEETDIVIMEPGSVTAPVIKEAALYTENPLWVFTSGKAPAFKTKRLDGRYILALEPPSGEWWTAP